MLLIACILCNSKNIHVYDMLNQVIRCRYVINDVSKKVNIMRIKSTFN